MHFGASSINNPLQLVDSLLDLIRLSWRLIILRYINFSIVWTSLLLHTILWELLYLPSLGVNRLFETLCDLVVLLLYRNVLHFLIIDHIPTFVSQVYDAILKLDQSIEVVLLGSLFTKVHQVLDLDLQTLLKTC